MSLVVRALQLDSVARLEHSTVTPKSQGRRFTYTRGLAYSRIGLFQKRSTLPPATEEISAIRRGKEEKIVSDNSKCIRASKGGLRFNDPLTGHYFEPRIWWNQDYAQLPQYITLIELPSLASATASFSFKSFETIFFKTFFRLFDIFPSTMAVAANIQRNTISELNYLRMNGLNVLMHAMSCTMQNFWSSTQFQDRSFPSKICQNNEWLDGMENSGVFKTMKWQQNVLITGS